MDKINEKKSVSIGLLAFSVAVAMNFVLFLVKLYVGISSGLLSVYCDAVNNLGDTFSCLAGVGGFLLIRKIGQLKSDRVQSLFSFVIGLVITVTGAYFVYNGIQRLFYPTPVSYSVKYAVLICATVAVKAGMGIMFRLFNKNGESSLLRSMMIDSFLDCFITITTLLSLFLASEMDFAIDGLFAVITGAIITVSAVKNLVEYAKKLINE